MISTKKEVMETRPSLKKMMIWIKKSLLAFISVYNKKNLCQEEG